jgi:hypothetical protein
MNIFELALNLVVNFRNPKTAEECSLHSKALKFLSEVFDLWENDSDRLENSKEKFSRKVHKHDVY